MIEKVRKLVTAKYYFLFEIVLIFFIVLNQHFFSFYDYKIRIYVYLFSLLYFLGILYLTQYDKQTIGLDLVNRNNGMKRAFFASLLFLILLLFTFQDWPSLFNLGARYTIPQLFIRILVYVLMFAPVQEILFRGYIITRLEQLFTNKWYVIVSSSFLFSIAHWSFHSFLLLVGTFILGIYLAINFLKYRNVYASMLVHGIVGSMVIILAMIFSIKAHM